MQKLAVVETHQSVKENMKTFEKCTIFIILNDIKKINKEFKSCCNYDILKSKWKQENVFISIH